MIWLRSLAVCCLLLLIPTHVAAAPAQMEACDFGSLLSQLPRQLYSMPFVDEYIPYAHETQLTIDGHILTLQICAPEKHAVTAERLLGVFNDALPKLNDYAGLPLSGGFTRQIVIAPDDALPASADAPIDRDGVIHLQRHSSETTVVREGAYYWANEQNLGDLWMIEGYAEYLTEQVTGVASPIALADGRCEGVALLAWRYDPPATMICGYVGGAAVFRDLATTIGAEQLRDALQQLQRERGQIDSWGLLIGLERISGQGLTEIFRGRVFPPAFNSRLDERDALRRRIELAMVAAGLQDLELPASLQEAFDNDAATTTAGLLDALEPVLETSGAIVGACKRLSLSCVQYWEPLPTTSTELQALLVRLRASHDLLSHYAALHERAQAIGLRPDVLGKAVSTLQPEIIGDVQRASDSLMHGQMIEQRCVAQGIVCEQWHDLWANDQIAEADSMIQGITALLAHAPGLEANCQNTGWPCARAWRTVFERSGDPQQTLIFIDKAQAAMPELAQVVLPAEMPIGLAREIARLFGPSIATLLDDARQAFAEGDLGQARTLALQARAAQQDATDRATWLPIAFGGLLILVFLLAGMVIVRRWRRMSPPKPVQQTHDQLLAKLLEQPPAASKADSGKTKKKAA